MRLLSLLLLLVATQGARAQQLLFDKTIPEQNVPEASRLKSEMRSHYINSRYVSQADFLSQQDFFISITSDLIVRSRFQKMYSYPTGAFSYQGKLEGPATGTITFSKYADRTAGMILLDDGTKYMIDQVAPNIFAFSLSNEAVFSQRESHSDFVEVSGEDQPNASSASVCDVSSACPGSSTIDMLVVYTQQAENSWGGAANTMANITQAITNMNASMSNSGINNVSFRFVHATKVSYTESGNFNTDLTRLAGTGDGYMDNVHSLRDQYGADLVSLIIGSPASSCGIGYLNTNPTSYSSGNAFNVSLYSCVVSNFTMAHECGHNMGLRHDWYVDASTTPCAHHHGYVNQVALDLGTASPASSRWRTIMAYNDRCAVAGLNCTRINHWSNPGVTYNGDQMGSAIGTAQPSDEAYAFYRIACLVASFRGESSPPQSCSPPSGLSTSGITASSGSLSWSPVSGAISYDVDYKLAGSPTWTTAATGTSALSLNLSGLGASSVYEWRVRANCSSGSTSYSQSQFSTLSIVQSCGAPYGLATSNITGGSAIVSWEPVNGATSYDIDYKPVSSVIWFNAASGTTSLSINLNNLSPSTLYEWTIKANCGGSSSIYSTSQFATSSVTPPPPPPSCAAPFGLGSSNITSGSATVSWVPVSGANTYDVEYKPASSGNWFNAASGTTSSSLSLNGLISSTLYDWRVKANCIGTVSTYSSAQFSTSAGTPPPPPPPPSSSCPGPFDISSNGNISGAAFITLNTDVNGTISPRNDIDHYKFRINTGGTITVSLTTLPANYNLAVLNSSGTQVAVSQNNGTQSETISLNVATGDYFAKVFPKGNANHSTLCYTLRVQAGTATDVIVHNSFTVNLFPNPAGNSLNVWIEGAEQKAQIKVYDIMGKLVIQQASANTLSQLNVSKLPAGIYLLNVNNGKETRAAKFVKE